MVDLKTRYLGLELAHPLMLGASPLARDLDAVRRAEDCGAAAIVMHSLFEEQLSLEHDAEHLLKSHEECFAESLNFRAHRAVLSPGSDEYLEQLRRIKAAVSVPVIGSLNGVTNRGWLEHASRIEQAGADALELNVYRVTAPPEQSAEQLEQETLDMVRSVKSFTKIPVALKLSPFYTALANFVARLGRAGADGVVLFNRFYQPDIDVERLQVDLHLELSSSSELLLRLRWLSILSPQVDLSLGVTGGVHSALDALKCVMAGASGVQVVSEILQRGPRRFTELRTHMREWLEEHGYESIAQMQKSMNQARCPDPEVYERANYMQMLNQWSRPRA
jgi:dihydroorotate dehydrogenase (fumarate)